jgi:dimethylargininase
VTHLEPQPVDADRARRQWDRYVATLARHGWSPIEVPAADECPDAVFVEDAVVMFGDLAVITRPGAPERRAEIDVVAACVAELGYRVVHITAPGRLDGGDVLKLPDGETVYVGRTGRTDDVGIDQLAAIVAERGMRVVAVPLTKVLHLKSAVTALPDGTVIGWEPALDDTSAFASFLAMPEEAGAHVVVLGDDTVLISAAAPRSAELLAARGLDVVPVEIDEFEKLEGCVTCLSVRLRA